MSDQILLLFLAEAANHKLSDLTGTSRIQPLTTHRHVCIYFLRQELNITFSKISSLINKNHSGVISAFRGIDNRLKTEVEVQEYYASLKDGFYEAIERFFHLYITSS